MHTSDKLAALRTLMRSKGIDGYIIQGGDAHGNSYVPDYWRTREWFSGFSGSFGIVVVTQDKAGLWTDGRYFIQAARELKDSEIELYKGGEPNVPTYKEFLEKNLPQNGKLAFDGRVLAASEYELLKSILKDKNITFAYQNDYAGGLWQDRPSLPAKPAFEHEQCFAGTPASEKLSKVREKMKEKKFTAYLTAALDDVAWLMNIRGGDLPNLPVVYSYALITQDDAHIFIDPAKVADISAKLTFQGFTLHNYDALPDFLGTLVTDKLYYNSAKANVLLVESIPKNVKTSKKLVDDIIPLLKAVKSPVELANIKNAFLKESVVLVKMLKWINEALTGGNFLRYKEGDVVRALTNFRKEQAHYLCDSFPTISAYGGNAAQAHYNSGSEGAPLHADGFLLVDTGGQYLDGTTDNTRTIALGRITDEMKRDFTLVLKGHIALSQAKFLKGTTGSGLDVLARVPLWEAGLNYKHGTGHGLGYCLSVHEGPHNIAPKHNVVELAPGMLISNEPAVYKEGRYGIRIENIIVVVESDKTPDGTFLAFETLTLCPIDLRAINTDLLTDTERDWLNNYHRRTYETLAPLLSSEECEWLKIATRAI